MWAGATLPAPPYPGTVVPAPAYPVPVKQRSTTAPLPQHSRRHHPATLTQRMYVFILWCCAVPTTCRQTSRLVSSHTARRRSQGAEMASLPCTFPAMESLNASCTALSVNTRSTCVVAVLYCHSCAVHSRAQFARVQEGKSGCAAQTRLLPYARGASASGPRRVRGVARGRCGS